MSSEEEIDENVSRLATSLLAMISKPQVMDTLSLVLATSKNEELLRKCAQLMFKMVEFTETMENAGGFFRQTASNHNVCRGFAEAVGQAIVSGDYETALKFVQVLGDIYYSGEVTQEELDFPDKDEVLSQLCDHCSTVTRMCSQQTDRKVVLRECSIISKLLQYLWMRLGCYHLSSFQKLGQVLMVHSSTNKENKKSERDEWEAVEESLETVTSANVISDGVKIFAQHYQGRLSLIDDDPDLKEILDFLKT